MPGALAGNLDEPLQLEEIQVDGVAASVGLPNEKVDVWRRLGLTSDELIFHQVASEMANMIGEAAMRAGHPIDVRSAKTTLLIVRPGKGSLLYLDSAAVTVQARMKVAKEAGQAIFAHEIADVSSMAFPAVEFEPTDKVVVFYREQWRFALYFDLSGELNKPAMETSLGRLLRSMQFANVYAVLLQPELRAKMIESGWFPFIEIHSGEFQQISNALMAGDDLDRVEQVLLDLFPSERIDRLFERWLQVPIFARRRNILRPGLDAFLACQPVLAIKTLATEIEGILQDAHVDVFATSGKMTGLINLAGQQAIDKAGADSLFFPADFQAYLQQNIFADFDPIGGAASASRHSAAHGAARPEAYTQTRALQLILTLDQLSFYLQPSPDRHASR